MKLNWKSLVAMLVAAGIGGVIEDGIYKGLMKIGDKDTDNEEVADNEDDAHDD